MDALLATKEAPAGVQRPGVGENLFRNARLSSGLTIDEVVARTRLARPYVVSIDEGRLGALPSGLYARAYVRAFAGAVGLDPDEAVRLSAEALPSEPDPISGLREVARVRPAETLGTLIADRLRDAIESRAWPRLPAFPAARYAAACLDALLLILANAAAVAVIARACGVSVDVLLGAAGSAVAVVCAFTSAMYFLLLAGVGGQTPGGRIFALPRPADHEPLLLRTVFSRAAAIALEESSIVVDWLCTSELPATRESTV